MLSRHESKVGRRQLAEQMVSLGWRSRAAAQSHELVDAGISNLAKKQ